MASQVKLTVLRGTNIPDNDPGPGHTDAYVIIDYEGDRHKTAVRETASPEWGDSFVLDTRPGGVLKLTLMDSDLVSDDTLGVASQRLPTVRPGQTREFKMTFQGAKGGEVHLMVEGM
jgi:Ca2+-dependent lipid-binding protein